MYDGKTVNKVINNKWLVQGTLEFYDIHKKKGYVTLYVADLGSQSGRLTAQSPREARAMLTAVKNEIDKLLEKL